MPRYFVTGATGFIGGELVKQLIGQGHQVVALVRSLDRTGILGPLGVELHQGDITDAESLRAPMAGADGVFHAAAWYRIGAPSPDAERINVDGTRNVLETARALGTPRVVYTSTIGVLGDTHGWPADETWYSEGPFPTEYDRTKWLAHYQVALPMARAGLPLVIVMPGLVYGPGDPSPVGATLVQLLRGRLFFTPRRVTFSWGYVEDVARGLRQAMDLGRVGESYLLAGPEHTWEEAFDLAAHIAGRRAPLFHPRPRMLRAGAAVLSLVERAGLRGPYAAETLRLMAGTTWIGSSAKAEQELGFTARPLAEGWRPTIEHELRRLGKSIERRTADPGLQDRT